MFYWTKFSCFTVWKKSLKKSLSPKVTVLVRVRNRNSANLDMRFSVLTSFCQVLQDMIRQSKKRSKKWNLRNTIAIDYHAVPESQEDNSRICRLLFHLLYLTSKTHFQLYGREHDLTTTFLGRSRVQAQPKDKTNFILNIFTFSIISLCQCHLPLWTPNVQIHPHQNKSQRVTLCLCSVMNKLLC